MSTPETQPPSAPAPAEKITLEFTPANLPPQSQRDLEAHATLLRTTPQQLLADLLQKKLGGLFTVRAA